MLITIRLYTIIITLELYYHRNDQVQIISQLHEIDQIFAQKLHLKINYHRLRRTVIVAFLKWMSVCAVLLSILIAACVIEDVAKVEYIHLLVSSYSLLKKALFGSAYITYAILIRHRIRAMHEVLDSNLLLLNDSPFEIPIDRERSNQYEAIEFRRLNHLWRLLPRIHETIELINATFKWSISMNFFVNVFDFCETMYYHFDQAFKHSKHCIEEGLVYSGFAFMFYYVLYFGLIIQMANSVSAEADKIAPKLHRLNLSGAITDEVQDFVSEIRDHFIGDGN